MTQNNLSCDSPDCASKKSKCCGAGILMDFQSEYSIYGDFLRFRTKNVCGKCNGPFEPKDCTCKLQANNKGMKYEYMIHEGYLDQITMSNVGKNGWKLVSAIFISFRQFHYIFIREIKE